MRENLDNRALLISLAGGHSLTLGIVYPFKFNVNMHIIMIITSTKSKMMLLNYIVQSI